MKKKILIAVAALATALAYTVPAGASQPAPGQSTVSGENRARLVVLFESPSVASALGVVSGPEADAYRAQLANERASFADWLAANAPNARIAMEYDTVLNGVSVDLRGANPALIAGAPGVRQVMHPIWMSPSMDKSLPLIEWEDATGQNFTQEDQSAGEGVLVGVIDTGIDHEHPFFDDESPLFQNEDGTCKHSVPPSDDNFPEFTNCKVIVAKVFNSDPTAPDFTPEDFFGHGTHVAGTVGGVSGTANQFGNPMSGVAPGAVLGNYNVFPGETGSASSDDIADGVDEAVADGMDVLNLSLGGSPQGPRWDVLDLALLGAADAGVISAVAAGNSGPGEQTIQSPGWTPWVITAGASTNPHFAGQTVDDPDLGATGAAVGDFFPFGDDPSTEDVVEEEFVTASYVWWDDIDGGGNGEACENQPLSGVDLTGEIALISRGTCTFTTKVRNAEAIGAIGVIIFNNVAGDPVAMGHDGTDPFPEIPAVMVSNTYGTAMTLEETKTATAGGPISDQDGTADIIAGFSSRGPTPNSPEGLLLKPDMVAPGVNVNSSVPDGGWAFFQGTSMATPHLAGSAAAIIWDRGWQDAFSNRDEMVKSLLVNNALDGVVVDHVEGKNPVGVLDEGAGRLLLSTAFAGNLWADPVSISLGQVRGPAPASGSTTIAGGDWMVVDKTQSVDETIATVDVTKDGDTLTVTVTKVARGPIGDVEGIITVKDTSTGDVIIIAYWVRF